MLANYSDPVFTDQLYPQLVKLATSICIKFDLFNKNEHINTIVADAWHYFTTRYKRDGGSSPRYYLSNQMKRKVFSIKILTRKDNSTLPYDDSILSAAQEEEQSIKHPNYILPLLSYIYNSGNPTMTLYNILRLLDKETTYKKPENVSRQRINAHKRYLRDLFNL